MNKSNKLFFILMILSLCILPSCKPAEVESIDLTATRPTTPTLENINSEPTATTKEEQSSVLPLKQQSILITEIARVTDLYGLSNAAWSPDGTKLASTEVGQIRIWQLQPDTSQHNFVLTEIQVLSAPTEGRVESITWSLDAGNIIGGSNDGAWLWDIENSKPIQEIAHEYGARSFAWSPGGTILASSSNDGKVRLWDTINDWQLKETLVDIPDTVREVAWSPDGKLIATTEKNEIHLWDADSRKLVGTLIGHRDFVGHIAWSPNSAMLASTSDDETIIIWDIPTMTAHQVFEHGIWVSSVAWSPNGEFIVSSAGDGTIRLWTLQNDEELIVLQAYSSDNARSLTWNQNNQLASVSLFEGTLKIWQVEFEN